MRWDVVGVALLAALGASTASRFLPAGHGEGMGERALLEPEELVDLSADSANAQDEADTARVGAEAASKGKLAEELAAKWQEKTRAAAAEAATKFVPAMGCPEGTCAEDMPTPADSVKNPPNGSSMANPRPGPPGRPLKWRKCNKRQEVPELSCPANSHSKKTNNSVACVNCNRNSVCSVKSGNCNMTNTGFVCTGCSFAAAGSVACTACPALTGPQAAAAPASNASNTSSAASMENGVAQRATLGEVSDLPKNLWLRERVLGKPGATTTVQCQKVCMECRFEETKNGLVTSWCLNVLRYNNEHPSRAYQIPTAEDQMCAPVPAPAASSAPVVSGQANDGAAPALGEAAALLSKENSDGASCEWYADAPFLKAPKVDCPCGTIKSQICNSDGIEETKCTLPAEMPAATCGENQATTSAAGFSQCTYCNHNGTCTIDFDGCTAAGCVGCKYVSGAKTCSDCPVLTGADQDEQNKEKRAWTSGEPCKKECAECKQGEWCVNVHRRYKNEPTNRLKVPTGDDEACSPMFS